MLFDLRLRTSPLVVASDASATGFGVCRTSSLEPKGLLALAALQEGHNFRGEEIGLKSEPPQEEYGRRSQISR